VYDVLLQHSLFQTREQTEVESFCSAWGIFVLYVRGSAEGKCMYPDAYVRTSIYVNFGKNSAMRQIPKMCIWLMHREIKCKHCCFAEQIQISRPCAFLHVKKLAACLVCLSQSRGQIYFKRLLYRKNVTLPHALLKLWIHLCFLDTKTMELVTVIKRKWPKIA
jgi:hypothetical protein